MNKQIKNNK